MHLTKEDLDNTERIRRLNIINSVTGIKPANLIGTVSGKQQSNLAIFSSVVHLGSNPALLGFVLRPERDAGQHTYENILETGYYTINHVHEDFMERAHYTSAKFKKEESEFDQCHFTEEYLAGFPAPFVQESSLKIGLKFLQGLPIEINGTMLIIGQIEHLIVPDEAIDEEGHFDLSRVNDVGISGLNSYYRLTKLGQFPYARPQTMPDFSAGDQA
ncbi:flavin reductase (DIM6/NTAB) family NADH-FMN oxidoreductase RutF [Larkinella arboricola]|uniref:Flavin reductase (DIM6/NTAB) family NADH-FMN oxidoreductase RutF n=1 Tax=Larkinella arboricola TaxID=643671 RepID=A0A327X6L4_LARAB|nr:flavin reductase [Larkinella arboricola]RAK02677.1 flavin reductase (DIM6/NTAB) family NADH-FMN oxidoreductase RutF [Larkinella arboricola]